MRHFGFRLVLLQGRGDRFGVEFVRSPGREGFEPAGVMPGGDGPQVALVEMLVDLEEIPLDDHGVARLAQNLDVVVDLRQLLLQQPSLPGVASPPGAHRRRRDLRPAGAVDLR